MGKDEKESKPGFGIVNFERRRHPRFSVDLPVECWQISNQSKSHPARTADISEGGLLLYISEEIEIGQKLNVNLFIDSEPQLSTIGAQVQVVWKDFRLEREDCYRIGVRFVDISLEDMDRLKDFLKALRDKKGTSTLRIPDYKIDARKVDEDKGRDHKIVRLSSPVLKK